ncbi:MAG TPA: isoprenylcysteine carboxylmethyltransferase family protein [Opitutaceae bacterium]|nr:isoprenylcysteine carboxylmethyltransferase family protein [Opitutaceae bacterium]
MTRKLIAAVVGTLAFILVPLFAWGFGDVRGFIQHPARLAYLAVTVLSQIGILLYVPDAGLSRKEGDTVVARQRLAVVLLQLLTVGIIVVAPYSDARSWASIDHAAVRYAGVLLYAAGLFLMNWAVVHLGRHFSVQVTLQKDHALVTHGPYRVVRHPRYTGILLCFAGVALIFASAGALVLVAALLATLGWRVHDEEAMMADAFPSEWPGYAQRTARLIPYVY